MNLFDKHGMLLKITSQCLLWRWKLEGCDHSLQRFFRTLWSCSISRLITSSRRCVEIEFHQLQRLLIHSFSRASVSNKSLSQSSFRLRSQEINEEREERAINELNLQLCVDPIFVFRRNEIWLQRAIWSGKCRRTVEIRIDMKTVAPRFASLLDE